MSRAEPANARPLLIVACLATVLVPYSSTSIAVALPGVRHAFGLSVGTALLLVAAYLVVTAGVQPLAGGLGDRFGRLRLLTFGVLGFGIATLFAAAAPDFAVLVVSRCLQAVAGSLALVNAAALLRATLPAEARGRAYGLLGAVAVASAAAGPPVGALAVGLLGWRGVFVSALPLVVVAAAAVVMLPPGVADAVADARPTASGTIDLLGAGLLLATLAGLSGSLSLLARGTSTPVLLLVLAAFGTALLAFGSIERRHPRPVLDLRVLRVPAVAVAATAVGAANFAVYTILLALPILLDRSGGARPVHAGLLLAPLLVGSAIAAPLGGLLADRRGRRRPAVLGHVLMAFSAAGLVPVGLTHPLLTVPLLGLMGIGQGLAAPALQAAGTDALPAERSGLASGVWSLGRYLGSIVGASVLPALTRGEGRPVFIAATVAGLLATGAAVALPAVRYSERPLRTGAASP
jgi:DHA2 family methylenomycin A resistance protein-like MFS transporter